MAPMDAEDCLIPYNGFGHFNMFPKLRDSCPDGTLLTSTEKITELRSPNFDVLTRFGFPA